MAHMSDRVNESSNSVKSEGVVTQRRTVSITEAQAQISRLIEEVEEGGEIIIQRQGRSVAVLKPYERDRTPRQLGGWEGRVWIADDFDELPDEIVEAFGAQRRAGH